MSLLENSTNGGLFLDQIGVVVKGVVGTGAEEAGRKFTHFRNQERKRYLVG